MTTATGLPATTMQIQCQKCEVGYLNPESRLKVAGTSDELRQMLAEDCARATGWRVWSGTTMGGREVRRVFCPRCLGHAAEVDAAAEPKWDARCRACDWGASDEDEYPAEPFTAKDAQRWKDDHRCEPDVFIIAPKQEAHRAAS